MAGRNLFLKAENLQESGSFKFRGATNAIAKLSKLETKPNGVVTKSCGNHGLALAKAAYTIRLPCYVVMPEWSIESKVKAIQAYGATVIKVAKLTIEARDEKVNEIVEKYNAVFVSPSNGHLIIAAQGTTAVEILEDRPDIDILIAPVGIGSLISGVAIAAKAIKPSIKIIGAEPENANHCFSSKQKGELIANTEDYDNTIADGLRGNVHPNAWPIIRDLVDDVITVSEQEILAGMMMIWEKAKLVVEPSSGVTIAAVMSEKFKQIEGKNVGVVLCGGNIDIKSIPSLLAKIK